MNGTALLICIIGLSLASALLPMAHHIGKEIRKFQKEGGAVGHLKRQYQFEVECLLLEHEIEKYFRYKKNAKDTYEVKLKKCGLVTCVNPNQE